ncbi:MAG: prealbumin-like fold domain-containing protein [Clostridiales bacterium]|nr:prealbumin-like fold domain-containing protein [Clostridiales bacterium]
MSKFKGIAAVFMLFLTCAVTVYAVQTRSGNESEPDNVIGQVTITNVDSADNSIRLNGARIKITDKETGGEYTDIISEDGTLVYELPLGSYLVSQAVAPENYQLNSRVFEFTLQVPPGTDSSNIKVVNASVMLTNDLIGAPPDPTAAPASPTPVPEQVEDTAVQEKTPTPTKAADPGKEVSPADKNPETADASNILLAILALLVIILSVGIVALKRINSKL